MLSSCHGGGGGDSGLAATLVLHGVDRVVAMQTAVGDQYATRLARTFYKHLAKQAGLPVAAALSQARRELEDTDQAAARAGHLTRPEHSVPTMFGVAADRPLIDTGLTADPLARQTLLATGGGVRRLPIGYLIGRRQQLRSALSALRRTPAAVEAHGALSGVLLSGVGGIGKTALAGRIETRLGEEGWIAAVHFGRWNPSELTRAVIDALDGQHCATDRSLAAAREQLTRPDVDDSTKLQLICVLLSHSRLLVLFDDFEQNLELAQTGARFSDPGFAEIFDILCQSADVGKLLVTSRYPPPGVDVFLLDVRVPPLSGAELRRLMLRLPALRDLQAADRKVLIDTIGGHPRLLEFVKRVDAKRPWQHQGGHDQTPQAGR
jgi:hypothetical protein